MKQVIWSVRSEEDKYKIFDYWTWRNQSSGYAIKLNERFNQAVFYISKHHFVGKKTKVKNVRALIVGHYILIYRIRPKVIFILTIWDSRQDPKKITRYL